jgi:hypothetical protein
MRQAAGLVNTAPPGVAAKVTPFSGSKLTNSRRTLMKEKLK